MFIPEMSCVAYAVVKEITVSQTELYIYIDIYIIYIIYIYIMQFNNHYFAILWGFNIYLFLGANMPKDHPYSWQWRQVPLKVFASALLDVRLRHWPLSDPKSMAYDIKALMCGKCVHKQTESGLGISICMANQRGKGIHRIFWGKYIYSQRHSNMIN